MDADAPALVLAAMAAAWLVGARVFWRARRALPPTHGETRYFQLGSGLWWMGPPLLFLGPGLMLFLLLLVPIGEKDIVPVVFLALFLGGFSPLMGVFLMRARFRVDDAGLVAYTSWGLDAFIPWHQVKGIAFNAASQSLRFEGGARPLYVLVQLHDWPGFMAEIERRLPHLALPAELQPDHPLRKDSELLAFEGHWQGMYDHAGYIAGGAALAVGAGLLLLEPHPPAWFWSALGGAGLALYPLLRRLVPKPRKYAATIGIVVQSAGGFVSIMVTMRGYHLHADLLGGEDALSGMQWLGLLLQTLGVVTFTAFTLLLLAKWCWPARYSRDRMAKHGRGEW